MTATEFIRQISEFKLPEAHFTNLGFEREVAQRLANGYNFQSQGSNIDSRDPIVNLVKQYDMSSVEIGLMSFFKDLKEDSDYVYFGLFEADYFAVSKQSDEVVIIDHEDGLILYRCALNSDRFLDAINLVWRTITTFFIDLEKVDDFNFRKANAEKCADLAGGSSYLEFYQTILGSEQYE